MNRSPDISDAVIVTAGWSPAAYDIVRALALAGLPSCVASAQRNDIAFFSRHCLKKLILPPFVPENHTQILKKLREFSSQLNAKPVLFYTSDPELWFVWQFREQLEPFYRFLLPPDKLIEKLFNKVLFHELAIEHRLPVPPTRTVSRVDQLPDVV